MADSSYYKKLYKQKKTAVKEYEDNVEDLRKILSNITDDFYDEIRNVNNELDDLKSDLNAGVRHNSSFTRSANELNSEKEKATSADPNLSVVIRELQEEIRRVNNMKNQAETDRDYYNRKYEEKKEQEKEEFWNNLF